MSQHDRLIAMDITRGVAVLGILLMNISAFAMPEQAQFTPLAYGGTDPANMAVWATDYVLVSGKMRALFTILFGASMLLVIDRAEASGRDGAKAHLWRMAWLLVIGLVHCFYIWWGDILSLYAMCGALALGFAAYNARALLRWSLALFGIQLLISAMMFLGLYELRGAAMAPDASREAVDAWLDMLRQIGPPSPDAIANDMEIYRSGYSAILSHNFATQLWTPIGQFMAAGAETLGMMLLGMALHKSGFFRGSWQMARYKRLAIGLVAGSGIAFALMAWWKYSMGFDPVPNYAIDLVLRGPLATLMAVGYAAIIVPWALNTREGWLKSRIEAAGKAALSNYVGTSILMTTIFYGYGLGLYGQFDRIGLLSFVVIGWIAMLAWSKPWLDYFRHGPLEWLWRSLARGERQPFRRA